MLKHEQFIAETANWDERAYGRPDEYGPKPDAVFDHRHHLQLQAKKVCTSPFADEKSAMYCHGNKERSGHPSMEPIDIDI